MSDMDYDVREKSKSKATYYALSAANYDPHGTEKGLFPDMVCTQCLEQMNKTNYSLLKRDAAIWLF